MLLHVLGHVDPYERLGVVKEKPGQASTELGLPNSRGTAEDKRADRTERVFQTRAGSPDRFRNGDDGFVLADKDLSQRGPGEFLGTRQSGYSFLKLASITDIRLVEKSRQFAQALFDKDPNLSDPAHARLVQLVEQIWSGGEGDIS